MNHTELKHIHVDAISTSFVYSIHLTLNEVGKHNQLAEVRFRPDGHNGLFVEVSAGGTVFTRDITKVEAHRIVGYLIDNAE